MDERDFERALAWFAAEVGDAALAALRQAFERTTGAIEPNEPDFEARMAHLWEAVMCDAQAGDAPIARYAGAHRDNPAILRAAAAWSRSYRSLFEVTSLGVDELELADVRRGGSYTCTRAARDAELRVGDRCDARLVVLDGRVWLSPGRTFYPEGTRHALDALLAQLTIDALPHAELLDALLRMRGNFLRFESMKAEHVFRIEALRAAPASAAWAIHRAR